MAEEKTYLSCIKKHLTKSLLLIYQFLSYKKMQHWFGILLAIDTLKIKLSEIYYIFHTLYVYQ